LHGSERDGWNVPQADVTPLQKKWSPIYSTNSSLMSWTPAR
jgi:hypothetical protein